MDRVKLSADTATTKKQITLYEKKKKSFCYWNARMVSIIKTHKYLSVHPLMLVPPILAEYIPEKQH